MKTFAFGLGILLFGIAFTSCEKEKMDIVPSAQITTRQHVITDFNDLKVADPFQVYIQFSDTEEALRIEANDNLHNFIKVKQVNDKVSIQLDDDIYRITGTPVLKVYLTTRDIRSIEGLGTAQIYLEDQWNEYRAEVTLTGASSLTGTLMTEQLFGIITGASNLYLEGTTHTFDLDAEGASNMAGFDFTTDQLTADLTGACTVALTVNEEIRVTASGGSTVHYRGNGVVTYQNLSGGSTIIKE